MPSGYGPWSAEDRGKGGGLLLGVAAAGAVGFGVVEVVTSEAFAIAVYVAVGVAAVLCVAGIGLVVRNVARDHGKLWKPVEAAVPAPVAALPVAVPLAIEAPKPVLAPLVRDDVQQVEGVIVMSPSYTREQIRSGAGTPDPA